jgi:hypothetical protein
MKQRSAFAGMKSPPDILSGAGRMRWTGIPRRVSTRSRIFTLVGYRGVRASTAPW